MLKVMEGALVGSAVAGAGFPPCQQRFAPSVSRDPTKPLTSADAAYAKAERDQEWIRARSQEIAAAMVRLFVTAADKRGIDHANYCRSRVLDERYIAAVAEALQECLRWPDPDRAYDDVALDYSESDD